MYVYVWIAAFIAESQVTLELSEPQEPETQDFRVSIHILYRPSSTSPCVKLKRPPK